MGLKNTNKATNILKGAVPTKPKRRFVFLCTLYALCLYGHSKRHLKKIKVMENTKLLLSKYKRLFIYLFRYNYFQFCTFYYNY